MQQNYDENEWNWCAALIEKKFEIKIEKITPEQLKTVIEDWKTNLTRLNNMIMQDAQKEFDSFAKIGYGIDGDDSVKNSDFESIHGTVAMAIVSSRVSKNLMKLHKKQTIFLNLL